MDQVRTIEVGELQLRAKLQQSSLRHLWLGTLCRRGCLDCKSRHTAPENGQEKTQNHYVVFCGFHSKTISILFLLEKISAESGPVRCASAGWMEKIYDCVGR